MPKARGGDLEEPPTPKAGREEQPEERWLRRHRRAIEGQEWRW